MTLALRISDLSKQYRLGQVGTGTISHDLNRWWAKIRGKEDPYSKVGQVNQRDQSAEGEYVWALKDINLEVEKGEVLGIIGANGAGKSTLLKLISRITSPTTGSIQAKGRIASLLEVGTGMHPEMTARENIYLNGSILGMRRHEIAKKFDDIIDFAGCRMFVDTPVKRFSSGMRVRLGFAVAAFLDPEILIVDEVLAVGDAEFQRRAIGKMKDVTQTGDRTVLFVSHNMYSIRQLCPRVVNFEEGSVVNDGAAETVIAEYISDAIEISAGEIISDDISRSGNGNVKARRVWIEDSVGNRLQNIESGMDFSIAIECSVNRRATVSSVVVSIALVDSSDQYVWLVRSSFDGTLLELNDGSVVKCSVSDFNLAEGTYRGTIFLSERDNETLDCVRNAFSIAVMGGNFFGTGSRGLPGHCKTLTRAEWTVFSQQ